MRFLLIRIEFIFSRFKSIPLGASGEGFRNQSKGGKSLIILRGLVSCDANIDSSELPLVFARIGNSLCFCYQNLNLHSVCSEFYTHFLSLTAMCFEYSCDCNEFYTHFLSHTAPKDETHVCVHTYISVDIKSCSFWYLNWKKKYWAAEQQFSWIIDP